ncbi:hypothetical protein PILCRDRAFT_16477 [Piloderma croceum F 1598]|uniref:CCHC-type domain-containing protein n=1 Tax=Piloderma croceum (strain F 1598) TaxID=765440 RepID=A0A0C3AE37_PILCF|nr:hypothetical protein PILCRDRAFT_16477 [Piloderma croceum F 1598]
MYDHLNLNFGASGPGHASTLGLPSPPQTQQQQHAGPIHPPPPPPVNLAAANPAHPDCASGPSVNPLAVPGNATAAPAIAGAQPPLPGNPAPPPLDAQLIAQQAAELTALRTRLEQLETANEGAPPRVDVAPAPPAPPVLFAPPDVVTRAKEAALAVRDSDRKLSLPDIVPGFKANSLDIPIPPKVDDAFKSFRYVLYSSLTLASRIRAAHGEEDLVFNAQGGLTVKSLDWHNEKLISTVDWHAAARAAEERIGFHHGEARAEAFALHHKLVMDLGCSHNWEIAMEYDIQQREVVALNPSHDLSSLDLAALTIIATHPVSHNTTPSSSLPKRSAPAESSAQFPRKHFRSHCFWCGGSDHFPADCKAEVTISGKPTAKLAPSAKTSAITVPTSMVAVSVGSPAMALEAAKSMPDPRRVVTPLDPD